MFKMLDLSVELPSAEKSYTFPFRDTFLELIAANLLDMIRKYN